MNITPEVQISLSLVGKWRRKSKFEELLGLSADSETLIGTEVGPKVAARFSLWEKKLHTSSTWDIVPALKRVLTSLGRRKARFHRLPRTVTRMVVIRIVCPQGSHLPGLSLEPRLLSLACDIGCTLEIDYNLGG